MTIKISVSGEPATQGSKIRTRYGVREANRNLPAWRSDVRAETQRVMQADNLPPLQGAVHVDLQFALKQPGHFPKRKRINGKLVEYEPLPLTLDPDKLARAVLDGLTAGGAIIDDRIVVNLTVSKRYAGQPGQRVTPGVDITIREVETS